MKNLKDLPTDKFAVMTVEEIFSCNLYLEISKKCTFKNPLTCSFSVFFADHTGHRWVGCCPESMAVPSERWGIKSSDENAENDKKARDSQMEKTKKKEMGPVMRSADKIKLFAKWQNQICPYKCYWAE